MNIKSKISPILEISLTILPFFLILIIYILFINNWNGDWIHDWMSYNRVFSCLILFLTLVAIIIKGYKYNWYFAWLGFLIYFSLINVIPYKSKFIIANLIDWLWNSVFIFMQEHHFTTEFLPPRGFISTDKMMIILILNLVMFYLLIKKFKATRTKVFLLIFTYFYSYCHFVAPLYYYSVQRLSINSVLSLKSTKTFCVINSIICIIFLIYFILAKSKIKKVVLTILFFFFNFIALNIFQIEGILSEDYIIGTALNTFIRLVIIYIKYFLLISNVVYFFIFLMLIKKKESDIDAVSDKGIVARQ